MPEGNRDLTDGTGTKGKPTNDDEQTERPDGVLHRRRLLQFGAAGALAAFGVRGVTSGATDHPNTIVFDGTVSMGKSKYTFEVTDSVEPNPDAGTLEVKDTIDGTRVSGAVHRDKDAYRFSGELSALDVAGDADVSVTYGDDGAIKADRLEIVAGSGASIDYSFTATDRIIPVTDTGEYAAETDDAVVENDDGSWTADGSTADSSGDTFDFWGDVTDFAPMDGDYTLFLNGSEVTAYDLTGETKSSQLVIDTPADGSVEYTFTTTGEITKDLDNGDLSAEPNNDEIVQNADGTWTATGLTGNGYGDTYDFEGDAVGFSPKEGSFTLYLDGTEVTAYELVGEEETTEPTRELVIDTPADSSVEYTYTTTGEITKDLDNGDLSADSNDEVVQNDDGTWTATGLTGNGYGDTYHFEGDAVDFSPLDSVYDGQFHLYLDGEEVTPLELIGEERVYDREHSYSFEGTGDSWADVYLEVEDDGRMEASTLREGTINPGYFWISDDGTRAAARVFPGDWDVFQFDNLVVDVTVDGTAEAYVDGNESSLDWYPQPGATGDGWKGGFPWQDGDSTSDDTTRSGTALGGGSGYDRIVTRADADYVVRSASGLQDALSSASSGEIVFVDGGAVIDTGGRSMDVPSGVTLASNRGENGAAGALLHTDASPQIMLRPQYKARVTGLRIRGPTPGQTVTSSDGLSFSTPTFAMRLEGGDVEVDNCEVWGWPDRAVAVHNPGAHVHHSYIYDNNGQGLGYGVAAAEEALIEYNYFHNNRHSVTCANSAPGYTARHNHFSPKSVMHICDVHDVFQGDTLLEENIVENGQSRTWDNPDAEGVAGYADGFNGGSLTLSANWFFDEGSAYLDGYSALTTSGNVYGGESNHDPADVIPDHPGMADRPWL